MDYAVAPSLGPGPVERLVLHKADCPTVRLQAASGDPVMTLFGCEGDPDPRMTRCSCLAQVAEPRR
jgi:hypothetical protein